MKHLAAPVVPPSVDHELQALASEVLTLSDEPGLIQLACLAFLCRDLLREKADSFGLDPEPLIALGDETVRFYAEHQGLDAQDIERAVQALQRVSTTYRYLTTLPD